MIRAGFALAGYFGCGNAGDDMIARRVRAAAPGLPWTTLGVDVSRWNPLSLATLFSRSKALVYGGGELFQRRTSLRSLAYYAALPRLARACGARFAAYGMGLDPALSGTALSIAVRTLDAAEALWFRDEESAELYRRSGGRAASSLAPDPVWTWAPGDIPPPSRSLRRVLWVPRDPAAPGRIRELSSKTGGAAGFLLLHPRRDARAFGAFPGLETWNDPDELPGIVAGYDAVVAMRYHALVLAALAGRPAVALAAHPKTASLGARLGFPVLPLDASAARVSEALQSVFERRGEFPARAAFLREESREGLARLTSFLETL